ncbi:MAG: Fic family protein [Deltaproteobacteria bacterium]|nr:Fic family protein [Deltaproteobacteria bacterium]
MSHEAVPQPWQPITALGVAERAIQMWTMAPLAAAWRAAKGRMNAENAAGLKTFNERLIRRLSVETGILERLYDIDRGTTEQLITQGFNADLVVRDAATLDSESIVEMLRDHEHAARLVLDWIGQKRRLTGGAICELHHLLTRHQPTTVAQDQFGNRVEIPLLRGQFKTQPNNPRRADGTVHEYCPPIHVGSEVDNLLRWLADYDNEDPIVVAAWLHHRFSQIHPFQDGNGRVSRALVLYVLIRADLLPVVVDRDARAEYIGSLEAADSGDLSPLVKLLERIETQTIVAALSIDVETATPRPRVAADVVASIAARLARKLDARDATLRSVNEVAIELRAQAQSQIEDGFAKLEEAAMQSGGQRAHFDLGAPDRGNAHWYRSQLVGLYSNNAYLNFREDHYFIKASVRIENARLVFVLSFHHVGRELSGVMQVVAFAELQAFESQQDKQPTAVDTVDCTVGGPLVFTHTSSVKGIAPQFDEWLDSAMAAAFHAFGERL